MPEAGNKMRAGRLLQGSIPAEGFALTAGKRARPGLHQLKRLNPLSVQDVRVRLPPSAPLSTNI